jgi:glutamine synthetase
MRIAFFFPRLKATLSKNGNRDQAVIDLVRELVKETKTVRFEGNNYSEEWQKEAKKRGLPVLQSSVEAYEVFNTPKAVEFLVRTNTLTKQEIHSRYHISVERYNKTIEIELHTIAEMVTGTVIPAVEEQLRRSHATLAVLKSATAKDQQQARVTKLEATYGDILTHLNSLHTVLHKAADEKDETKRMRILAAEANPVAGKLREASDTAERMVADELWKLPKYREMLFANTLS